MSQPKNVTAVMVILTAVFATGCMIPADSADSVTVSDAEPRSEERSPVRIAFLQDKTGSAEKTRTPQLASDHVGMLIELLRKTGGELGIGLIRDESNRGLLRLRIECPPRTPEEPRRTGRLFHDARGMEAYRDAMEKYMEQLARWSETTDQRVKQFEEDLKPLLEQDADASHTDIWGAVRRADLFLAEPAGSWPNTPHGWAVFASDGIDNRKGAPVTELQSSATVLLVNGAAELGALAGLAPKRFESNDAAFRYLCATEGGN